MLLDNWGGGLGKITKSLLLRVAGVSLFLGGCAEVPKNSLLPYTPNKIAYVLRTEYQSDGSTIYRVPQVGEVQKAAKEFVWKNISQEEIKSNEKGIEVEYIIRKPEGGRE